VPSYHVMPVVQLAAETVNQGASAADWVEAIATVVAAVGTVGAFMWQARALAQERETRRAEITRLANAETAAQASQAKTIVLYKAMLAMDSTYDADGTVLSQPGSVNYMAMVGNFGTLPVTKLVARLTWTAGQKTGMSWQPLSIDVLGGGDRQPLIWDLRANVLLNSEDPDSSNALPDDLLMAHASRLIRFAPEIEFTDVHGWRWGVSVEGTTRQQTPGLTLIQARARSPHRVERRMGQGVTENDEPA
jgi:hypothetical protein